MTTDVDAPLPKKISRALAPRFSRAFRSDFVDVVLAPKPRLPIKHNARHSNASHRVASDGQRAFPFPFLSPLPPSPLSSDNDESKHAGSGKGLIEKRWAALCSNCFARERGGSRATSAGVTQGFPTVSPSGRGICSGTWDDDE